MNEPTTNEGYLADLEKWGCRFDGEEGAWLVTSPLGGTTALENEDQGSALMEAWHLMKP